MKLENNMSTTDRIVRVVLFVLFTALYFTVLHNTLGLVLFIAGSVFLITSLVNWCPIYSLFGFATNK